MPSREFIECYCFTKEESMQIHDTFYHTIQRAFVYISGVPNQTSKERTICSCRSMDSLVCNGAAPCRFWYCLPILGTKVVDVGIHRSLVTMPMPLSCNVSHHSDISMTAAPTVSKPSTSVWCRCFAICVASFSPSDPMSSPRGDPTLLVSSSSRSPKLLSPRPTTTIGMWTQA